MNLVFPDWFAPFYFFMAAVALTWEYIRVFHPITEENKKKQAEAKQEMEKTVPVELQNSVKSLLPLFVVLLALTWPIIIVIEVLVFLRKHFVDSD